MDTQVESIVKTYSAPSDSSVTGITYMKTYGLKQRFAVIPQRLGEYLDAVCELCHDDEDAEKAEFRDEDGDAASEDDETLVDFKPFGHPVAEMISKRTIPVMVKMHIPFTLTLDQRNEPAIYDHGFVIKATSCIQSVLFSRLNIGPSFVELLTVVEESRLWSTGPAQAAGTTRDSSSLSYVDIRFTFPYCQVDVSYQRKKLLPEIIEALRQRKVMAALNIQPTADWPLIVQPIGDMIPLYRGKDDRNAAPMTLSHIYGVITDTDAESEDVEEKELDIKIFNPENFQYVFSKVTPATFLSKDVELKYWLPIFLSIHFWQGETTIKEIEALASADAHIEYDETVTSKDPKVMITHLLPLLVVDRVNIEPFWREIGQIIFNIFGQTDDGLSLFIDHSSKSSEKGRDREACIEYYRQLTKNHLTIKTIGWYARADNLKKYQTWHNCWVRSALFEALSLVHDEVAEVIYRIFWLDHIWVGGDRWMLFKDHRLVEQKDATDLRREITDKLVPIYKALRCEFEAKSAAATPIVDRKQAEAYIKQITAIIDKLGNYPYKTTVIKATRQLFEVKDFDRIKDSDASKTGWANCVVVCSGNHAYTMEGKLEDFITKSTFTPYRADLNWQHPLVQKLLIWFGQMFPDRDLNHYVFKDLASYLFGRNAEKLLRFWCGDGNNSKTMLAKCIQMWLGLYCVDFPPTFLTGKPMGTSGPNPELAQAHGAHVGFVPETEDDEKIREGTAKRATGGDRQFARMCNENGGPMEMMAKVVLMCNKIPEFTSISKALRNRFTYVPFLATWSDDAPESIEEQYATRTFKNDPFFESQLPELSQALGWVAVQYYYHYKIEGLTQPRIVTEYTARHWEENDPMLGFISERLQQCYSDAAKTVIDQTKSLSATEIYPVYRSWFATNYPGTPVVSQPIFRASLQQRLGPQGTGKRWYGIAIVQPVTMLAGSGSPDLGLVAAPI